jgi:mannobiose 2-epimerase
VKKATYGSQKSIRIHVRTYLDKEYGGVYWMVDDGGRVINERKQAYNLAFAIYGLSEYYRVSGDEEALNMAKAVFYILERYYKDNVYGGYIEQEAGIIHPLRILA